MANTILWIRVGIIDKKIASFFTDLRTSYASAFGVYEGNFNILIIDRKEQKLNAFSRFLRH